uniref:XRN2-binding (XTBD) domain-containing protein n=1 Tax=Syphacia muris TaxID=451379 RepID=A0A0N5AQF9_9BILA
MDKYLTKEDVDSVRSKSETDEQWEARRQFIIRHISSYPKNRLLCLSELFVNIKYNKELTKEVIKLGFGIVEKKQKRKEDNNNSFERSLGLERKKINIKGASAVGLTSPEDEKKKTFVFLKAESSITDKGLEPLQRLNQIVSRVKVGWELTVSGDVGVLSVNDVVILSNKFLLKKTIETKQYAAAAALHGINAENVEIRIVNGKFELWHNDTGPGEYYIEYLKDLLQWAHKRLPANGSSSSRLEAAFRTSGLSLGWEQEISFTALNLTLGSKILHKDDYRKAKESEHKELLATSIIEALMRNQFSIQEVENGFILRSNP